MVSFYINKLFKIMCDASFTLKIIPSTENNQLVFIRCYLSYIWQASYFLFIPEQLNICLNHMKSSSINKYQFELMKSNFAGTKTKQKEVKEKNITAWS